MRLFTHFKLLIKLQMRCVLEGLFAKIHLTIEMLRYPRRTMCPIIVHLTVIFRVQEQKYH